MPNISVRGSHAEIRRPQPLISMSIKAEKAKAVPQNFVPTNPKTLTIML